MKVKSIAFACCPSALKPLLDRIENSPLGYRLAKGVFWSIAGALISRGLMLVASIIVARMLGKEVFGEYGMIRSTIAMFGIFAGFGLGMTATKHVAEFRRTDPERTGRVIGMAGLFAMLTGGLISLGLFIFAPWLAEYTINAPHLTGVLRISALILFINALNGAQTGSLSGFEAFKTIAHINLWVGLISFPILICGAWFGGLTGVVWALTINFGFNWLFNHIALRKVAHRHGVPFTLRNCISEWPVLWTFTIPLVFSSILVWPVRWICNAMLVNQPGGYDEMAIFFAADQWYIIMLFIPEMLGRVTIPLLSEQLGCNESRTAIKVLLFTMKFNFLVVSIPIVLLSLASPYIMSFYGESYMNGWPTLVVSLLTAAIIAVQAPIGHLITASGKVWLGFAVRFIWALLFVSVTALLLDHGALGLSLARAVSYVAYTVITAILVFCVIYNKENRLTVAR